MSERKPEIVSREEAQAKLREFVHFNDETARERAFFDGGSFLLYLAPPEGWHVTTDAVHHRFPPGPLTEDQKTAARDIADFRQHEKRDWRVGEALPMGCQKNERRGQ